MRFIFCEGKCTPFDDRSVEPRANTSKPHGASMLYIHSHSTATSRTMIAGAVDMCVCVCVLLYARANYIIFKNFYLWRALLTTAKLGTYILCTMGVLNLHFICRAHTYITHKHSTLKENFLSVCYICRRDFVGARVHRGDCLRSTSHIL